MDQQRFESLVLKAMEELPEEFKQKLENVDVTVESYPSKAQIRQFGLRHGSQLLGLYQGIPQINRNRSYNFVLPDRITVFQKPIEARCHSDKEIEIEIGKVVYHEVAHHFGIGDETLRKIEHQKQKNGKS